jgi:hypothetical protein
MRDLLRAGSSAVLLVVMMFVGSLVLWVGVPLLWLYIGSQVQGATDSIGTALSVMMVGVLASIALLVPLLSWLNRKHIELREARGLESYGQTALEAVLVISAGFAVVAFAAWFFLFSGSSPIPLNLGY